MDTKIYASLLSDLILKPTPETDIMILILKIRQLGPREAKEPAQVYRAGLKLTPEQGAIGEGNVAGRLMANTSSRLFVC